MTTMARKTLTLNDHDNTTLTCSNLESVCVQRDNDYKNGTTYWIFEDGSALLESNNSWSVITNYGLHCDHEQLN